MLSIPSTIFFTVIQFKQYFYHKLEIGGVIYAVMVNLFNILFLLLLIYQKYKETKENYNIKAKAIRLENIQAYS